MAPLCRSRRLPVVPGYPGSPAFLTNRAPVAQVFDRAEITEGAVVCDIAKVYGDAKVGGNARVEDHARVSGTASVTDNASVYGGDAEVCCISHYLVAGIPE